MNKFRLFVAAIASTICGSVMADSAPMFGMPGSNVMPISNNDIRLVSETIDFYLHKDFYEVEVNYNFYNEGRTQEIEVGFPTVSGHNDEWRGYKEFRATELAERSVAQAPKSSYFNIKDGECDIMYMRTVSITLFWTIQ